jgi:hypothetical protein
MRITSFLIVLFSTLCSFAKDKPQIASEPSWLYPSKPDLSKQPDLKKVSNGFYLELLDQQINLPTQTAYNHYIRKIVNESGIQNASEISVTFSPSYQKLIFHYVRVIRNGIVQNHLNLNEISVINEESDVDNFQYTGHKRAFLILKDIRKGDRIEAAYSLTGFNPAYNNKFIKDIYFSNDDPILNYYQTIIAEPSRQLKFNYYKDCPKAQELNVAGAKIYHWNNPNIKLWESISNTPSWFDPYPYVTVSEFSTWYQVVDWVLGIYNKYDFELPADLKKKIIQWKKETNGDEDEFVIKALRYVQDEIRYVGLEIGINTHKPHPPAEVVRNAYGDCKDKALLLSAILRSENIQAYSALVNTNVKGDLINRSPSPNEFDHVIVAIEKNGTYKYVDPTLSFQKGEINETYTPPYQYALLIKPNEKDLRFIDPSENNIVRCFERLNIEFNDSSTLITNTTYRGGKADAIRSYFATTNTKDISDAYVKYYSPTYDGILMSKDILHEDDTVNNMIKVDEEYKIPSIWNTDDSIKKYFFSYAKIIDELLVDPAGKPNQFPLSLSFPIKAYYTLDILMPESWTVDKDQLHIKNDSYEFDFKASYDGTLIRLEYSLVTFKDHIPAAEIEQYKKDYKKIANAIQYKFTYDQNAGREKRDGTKGINLMAILLFFLFTGLAATAFYFLNRKTIDVPYDRDSGYNLGGWVIVLGLTIIINSILQVYNVFNGGYFEAGSYELWKSFGTGFTITILTELTTGLIWMYSSFALIYWYFKRRDIFPLMFNGYVAFILLTQGILYIMYKQYLPQDQFKTNINDQMRLLIRLVIYGAIWCSYVTKSARVKGTFLKGY